MAVLPALKDIGNGITFKKSGTLTDGTKILSPKTSIVKEGDRITKADGSALKPGTYSNDLFKTKYNPNGNFTVGNDGLVHQVNVEIKPVVDEVKTVVDEIKVEDKAEVKDETKVEVKPDTKAEIKTEVKPEETLKIDPLEIKTETKEETKVEVKPTAEVVAEVKPEVKTEVTTEVKP